MTLNPPPSAALLRSREQAAMGRAPAEEGMGPGVPPSGPVVTRARGQGLQPDLPRRPGTREE
jgi:hypothetical protein